MKTIVKGKITKCVYSVVSHAKEVETDSGEKKVIYTAKPEFKKESEVIDWVDICSFDHEPYYNKKRGTYSFLGNDEHINIGKDEVSITEERFIADKDELHVYVDKVVKENDDLLEKGIAEIDYKSYMKAFNESIINTNEKMKAYCKLHHMEPCETDAIELFKLLYDTPFYVITDGKIHTASSEAYSFAKELDDKIKNWKLFDETEEL